MYIPKHFEGSQNAGRQIMQAHSWALLMTTGEDGAPFATHLSLLWRDDGSAHGSLIGADRARILAAYVYSLSSE